MILTQLRMGARQVKNAPLRHLKPLFPRYRGALGTCMQLMVTLGIFFVNLNCETDWRLFSGICIVFPAVLGLWMFWMPRSVLLIILSHYLSF